MSKIKALVVVAHADDETVWMGGTLQRFKDKYDWTICCVSQDETTEVGKVFVDVCKKIYKAEPVLLSCHSLEEDRIIKELAKFNHKIVYTHNVMGDAGHPNHIKVHNIVKAMNFEKLITFWPYEDGRKDLADISVSLTKMEKRIKIEIIKRYSSYVHDSKKITRITEKSNVERFLIPKTKENSVLYKFYTMQWLNQCPR